MNVFILVLAVAFGIFSLLAAVIALRQRRHPHAGCSGGQGCACQGRKIRCLEDSPRGEGEQDMT
jgi:hypothetical protein